MNSQMISTTLPHNLSKDDPYFDVILISGEYWVDHPHSGIGVIARVLEKEGYSIGIIEKPNWKTPKEFMQLGLPKLFFGISSGSIDSMLQNYTPLKKRRSEDRYNPFNSNIPDRAIIVYSQMIHRAINLMKKDQDKTIPIVLGGVEASLRRFTHYDYWDNKVRKPILFDAKADILVYGPGEFQIVEIARRLAKNTRDTGQFNTNPPPNFSPKDLMFGIPGTAIIMTPSQLEKEKTHLKLEFLPSYSQTIQDKTEFCKMQLAFSNQKNLVQKVQNRYLVQFTMHPYSTQELDTIYTLPFSYDVPDNFPEFKMAQFSIITHRGCIGECNFCSIALHQGNKIVSRSLPNILEEIKFLSDHPDFSGYIDDLGGASANMYGMDCDSATLCSNHCMDCPNLDRTHEKALKLLQESRSQPNIKKVFVRSGIRYDMIFDNKPYLEEISNHHISGSLKIAPEHFSPHICALMNKNNQNFDLFVKNFQEINENLGQELKYYFLTAHPGSTMKDAQFLRKKIQHLGEKNSESIQIFTPTPMSISTCMYYTGLNPFTLKPIYVPYTYREKKEQKNVLYSKKNKHDNTGRVQHKKTSYKKKKKERFKVEKIVRLKAKPHSKQFNDP